jgi:hypothetical protein
MPAETYVYGVMRHPASDVACKGVAGSSVYSLRYRDLSALVSDVPERVRAKRRDLMSHSDVLQTAFRTGTVIPLRFGTVFPAASDVEAELLEGRYGELTSLIDDLAGYGEVRVRADYAEDAVLAEIVREDQAVRAFHGRRGSEVALGEAVARALAAKRRAEANAALASLAPLARDVVVDEPQSEYELIRASFLVPERSLETFADAVERIAAGRAGTAAFALVGPLPPHSFVRLGGR